jgi:pantoate--beta-alanine ligase
MELINDPKLMQQKMSTLRGDGKQVVFVPTMGALHDGHLSLVSEGKAHGDTLVMSIYLNPTQFGPGEDLREYPAELEKDLELAKKSGVDILFCPTDTAIYPEGFQTYVETTEITKNLCGASRPEHFKGVTTVVLKLFNIIKPNVAIFGKKDYQQLKAVERLVRDLNLEIKIIGAPIVREEDGLAMSSRNVYLSGAERQAARSINRSLEEVKSAVKEGETELSKLISIVQKMIEKTNIGRVNYIKICHPETLAELQEFKTPALLAVAAHFGPTRLIDNCIL